MAVAVIGRASESPTESGFCGTGLVSTVIGSGDG